MKRLLALALLGGLAACAPFRPVTASSGDLADYRRTRLAATVPEHLVACAAYLEHHPDGAWAAEVRADWEAGELAYFERAKTSRERAVEYLSWLPHGPHADAALAVLRAFDGHVADDETAHLVAAAKKTTAALDRQANERKAIEDDVLAEIAAVARAPLGAAPSAASDLFAVVRGPRPTTWGDGLVRTDRDAWVLPTREGPVARELERTIAIELRDGVVAAVELRGGGLFVALAEIAATRPFADGERGAALAHVIDVVKGALSAGAGCTDEEVDGGFTRRCSGSIVYVRQGEAGALDRIGIRQTR
jgi:hypothetical protein